MKVYFSTALVSVLALAYFIWTGMAVGRARAKHGVKAPAVTGPEEFNRTFRVQQNTLEQIVVFLPSLWLAQALANAIWVPLVGLVWIVGRILYGASYQRDPKSRSTGFMLTFVPTVVLLLTALILSLKGLFSG
ncbi:MAG: MAPEG family protein [Sphingomonadales bacterium]|nr:MAPEG family protein [Sphingomonadales bacterium]